MRFCKRTKNIDVLAFVLKYFIYALKQVYSKMIVIFYHFVNVHQKVVMLEEDVHKARSKMKQLKESLDSSNRRCSEFEEELTISRYIPINKGFLNTFLQHSIA